MRNKMAGFSLIELMIALVIFAILAAVAIPSYRDSVKKGRRVEARSLLMENAQFMERFMTENNRYDLKADGTTAVALPVTRSPSSTSATKLYDISFQSGQPTATTYRIQAVPVAGAAMASDECGTYILDNFGARTNSSNSLSSDDCWSK